MNAAGVVCKYDEPSSYDKVYDKSVDVAVKSFQTIQTYPVQSIRLSSKIPVVEINSGSLPIMIRFNSHSSQINAVQKHFGQLGTVQKASHIDEPDLLIQQIKKPVIQEVREIIQPFRQRTQEVRPVSEKVETIIAQGKDYPDKKFVDDLPPVPVTEYDANKA